MLKRIGSTLVDGLVLVVGYGIGAIYAILAALLQLVLGRLALYAAIVMPLVAVGLALEFGTEGLMALGLSRHLAGSVVTLVVVAGCAYGLYGFARYGIDWE